LGVGVRYDIEKSWLKGLSPYARYLIQDQQVDSLRPQDVPIENIRATVIGADYHIWRLTFNAEHEWHDSSLLPFDAGRYSVRYEDRLSDRVNLSLIGGYTQYVYTDIHNHVNTLNAAAQVDARLSERWTLLGRITYLDDQDDLNGLTRGLEESVELRWKYRQTEIFGRARNANLEGDVTKQDFVTVEMGFRRTF
ncbi:MAG TPA: hypothetical protein VLI90_14580, partial [Tepidisphaeraceae bacterium]|nr:hypothetical protein [Tepidisphaeraceae bacterium]